MHNNTFRLLRITGSLQASLLDAATANALLLAVMIIRVSVTVTQVGEKSFPLELTYTMQKFL